MIAVAAWSDFEEKDLAEIAELAGVPVKGFYDRSFEAQEILKAFGDDKDEGDGKDEEGEVDEFLKLLSELTGVSPRGLEALDSDAPLKDINLSENDLRAVAAWSDYDRKDLEDIAGLTGVPVRSFLDRSEEAQELLKALEGGDGDEEDQDEIPDE